MTAQRENCVCAMQRKILQMERDVNIIYSIGFCFRQFASDVFTLSLLVSNNVAIVLSYIILSLLTSFRRSDSDGGSSGRRTEI